MQAQKKIWDLGRTWTHNHHISGGDALPGSKVVGSVVFMHTND